VGFPDGKLPAGRWRRPSVGLVVTGLLLGTAASSSSAVLVARHEVHITATGDVDGSAGAVFGILDVAVVVLSLAAWLAWLVIQIPSYRKAGGERRQQLKWLYSGAAITLVTFILGVFVIPVALGGAPGSAANPAVGALFVVGFGALPVFMGVAVLKYRLYELDRIISRVVSYALVTGLLVGVYAGLVLLATRVLPFRSAVAVAVSTLICAALFNPVRRRVQHTVNRRFNRSQYNAQAVVEAFTVRLQHHVGLDLVQQDLISAVNQAFQPTHVTIFPGPGTPPELGAAATGQSGADSRTQALGPRKRTARDDLVLRWFPPREPPLQVAHALTQPGPLNTELSAACGGAFQAGVPFTSARLRSPKVLRRWPGLRSGSAIPYQGGPVCRVRQ
jgi:hypothetical protein